MPGSWSWLRERTHETSFVGQYCGLLVPIDHPDRQCKRLSRRGSIGRRCRAYDPPYLSRYFWRLCAGGWYVHHLYTKWHREHPNGNLTQFADDYHGWLPAGWDERLRTAGDAQSPSWHDQ